MIFACAHLNDTQFFGYYAFYFVLYLHDPEVFVSLRNRDDGQAGGNTLYYTKNADY